MKEPKHYNYALMTYLFIFLISLGVIYLCYKLLG